MRSTADSKSLKKNAATLKEALGIRSEVWVSTQGSSMLPCWPSGAWLLLKRAGFDEIRIGDCIAYGEDGDLITHRLIVKRRHKGQLQFKAKADSVTLGESWRDASCLIAKVESVRLSADAQAVALNPFISRCIGLREASRSGLHTLYRKLWPSSQKVCLQTQDSAEAQRLCWGHNQLLTHRAVAISDQLRAAGMDSVLLKGLAHCLQGWSDASTRTCGDIDLWVSPHEAPQAIAVLQAKGWQAAGSLESEQSQLRHKIVLKDETGVFLDLHWSLINGGWRLRPAFALDAAIVQQEKQLIQVKDTSVWVLRPEAALLYAMMHLMLSGAGGQKWWAELAHWMQTGHPQIDWTYFVQLAERCHAVTIAWTVMDRLVQRFGVPFPHAVILKLRPHMLKRLCLRFLLPAQLKTSNESRVRRYLRELALPDCLSASAAVLWRAWHPPEALRRLRSA